jgi:photosystem II stability/assembly factor-like uncharacterized protein
MAIFYKSMFMKNKLLKTVTLLWLLAVWQPAMAQVWEILNPLPEGTGRYRCHFVDAQNGWVFRTGSPQLLRTRDGGNTWTELYPMTGMRHIFMADTLVGYMIVKEGVRKYLFRTTDGGLNWEQKSVYFHQYDQPDGTSSIYVARKFLYFKNQWEGFLVDDNIDGLLHTSDGGNSWNSVLQNVSFVNDIVFLNDSLGWLGSGIHGNCSGDIYYTHDGGLTWTRRSTGRSAHYHIDMLNDSVGFSTFICTNWAAVTGFNKTSNNFQTTEIIEFPNSFNFLHGKYVNDNTIFFAGTPKVFKMHRDSINPLEIIDLSDHLGGFTRIEPHKKHVFLYGHKIVRYTDTLYVGIQQPFDAALNGIKLFPNPATHEVYVTNLPNQVYNCTVQIISVVGNIVKTIQLLGNNKIDVSDVPSGLYFISIQHNNKIITKRMYINR